MKSNKNVYVQYTTPEFTAAFPALFTPRTHPTTGKTNYSVTMLFDKNTDISEFKKKVEEVAKDFFGTTKGIQLPFLDGNADEVSHYNGYKGTTYVKAKSSEENKPKILDQKLLPIDSPDLVYAGCKCRASVSIHPYNNVSKGVTIYLNGVQLMGNGERLATQRDCTDDFDEIAVEEADDDMLS